MRRPLVLSYMALMILLASGIFLKVWSTFHFDFEDQRAIDGREWTRQTGSQNRR